MNPWVAVDIFAALVPGGGIGRYVRDLTAALMRLPDAPPARFVCPRDWGARARALYPADRVHELPWPWLGLRFAYQLGTLMPLRFDRWFGEAAVVHSPVGYGPAFRNSRLLCHVHDLTSIEHPEWHPTRANLFLRHAIPHAARHADTVLTHSRFVASRVRAVFGVPDERIVTIPPPIGHRFHPVSSRAARERVTRRYGLEGPFVLHVGTLEPRKNHVGLVGAFERMRRAGFPGPLVLAGREGWRVAPILARIAASPERAAVMHVRDADDDDLVALYGACTVCAYPSLEEGFGMPVLESMACGAPIVTSDHASLIELGAGYAVAVPATDEDALAAALLAVWRDPVARERAGASGPARAADYRWERWAQRTFELYRRELEAAGVPQPDSQWPLAVGDGR
jgi:glycosyltransferase involved in cell wall biosynthesis